MGLTNFILTVAGVSAVVLLLRSDVKQSAAIFRRNVKSAAASREAAVLAPRLGWIGFPPWTGLILLFSYLAVIDLFGFSAIHSSCMIVYFPKVWCDIIEESQ